MRVTERERRHFDAIRRAKQAEHEERLREALQTHPVARILQGLALGAGEQAAEVEAALDRRATGQAELGRRARALGLRGEHGRHRETP
jgi:hypothetical protein